MNYTALSLAQTPPLSVPLRFFITAPLFTIAAGLIALWFGPELFESRWSYPLLAATHAITLGFLGSVMIGALQQLLPVLAGTPLPKPVWLSATIHLLLTVGVLLLMAGWLLAEFALFEFAIWLLAAALLPLVLLLIVTLFRSESKHPSILTMIFAVIGLAVTAVLGLDLLAGYTWSEWVLNRGLTDIHLGWGLVGWLAVLVAGVAYQVVPMFQITPDYPKLMMRGYAPMLLGLLLLWTLLQADWITWLIALMLAVFAIVTLRLQHQRRRRIADVTLDFWRLAMGSLLLALLLWLLAPHLHLTPIAPVVVLIAGFAVSAVNGMLYKIVPFLIWLHLNNRVQALGSWQGKIPNMKQIIPERQARWQFRLQLAALIVLFGALLVPEWLLRPAALLWIASAAWLGWNLLAALYLFRRIVSDAQDVG
ncbi:hypothetical protein BOW53_08110 [Solemya pervernicosa gill symbiont]|uniref:Uncharacterized protein n=2 Tax=Gammaproteobacteria incertae sedis TaxID=118884 RepID=A0A1T2L5E0_9GAMM|nr:hypothetical protein [Candidatus Reidiella endopervernicosa]OOZ40328.1 hypothetical protein BOW53_08110 [Solemya pervernicosa gill symbiont]QKQ24852.1 hypothetical protein HUE57_00045 [Candidatus Reidiella endopervernicosa]